MEANGGKNAEESKEADGAAAVAVVAAELMLQLVKRFNADYKCHTHTNAYTHKWAHTCAHTHNGKKLLENCIGRRRRQR